jgi:tRNA pseudouridine55 synthase
VVDRARRILQERSIGHLGTLDPMATGVLPLVVGNLTRLAQFYLGAEKTYEGTVRFGFATNTYDAEGDSTTEPQAIVLQAEEVEALAAQFRGTIEQTPPPFSAKKIKGVPAYKMARKQQEVVLPPVQVEIKSFEILEVSADRASFRARVASGTYMRSVAHEMGRRMGCGAHLESLRRTAVAEFMLEDAHTLDQLGEAAREWLATKPRTHEAADLPEALASLFIHPRQLLPDLPSVTADEATVARIRSGRAINLPDVSRAPKVKVFQGQRELVAIATRIAGTLFHPKIVLCGTDTPVRPPAKASN